jgi:hypothetical protein
VARARLSEDNSKLEDVDVLAEGVERNIVLAPDGTMFVLGADRFRFYDSDLDGVESRLHRQPRHPPQLHRPRDSHQSRWLDPERQPVARTAPPCCARPTRTGSRIRKAPRSIRRRASCGPRSRPQGGDEINIVSAGSDYGWPDVSYGKQYDARQPDGKKNVPVAAARRAEKASRSRSTSGCRRSPRRE